MDIRSVPSPSKRTLPQQPQLDLGSPAGTDHQRPRNSGASVWRGTTSCCPEPPPHGNCGRGTSPSRSCSWSWGQYLAVAVQRQYHPDLSAPSTWERARSIFSSKASRSKPSAGAWAPSWPLSLACRGQGHQHHPKPDNQQHIFIFSQRLLPPQSQFRPIQLHGSSPPQHKPAPPPGCPGPPGSPGTAAPAPPSVRKPDTSRPLR